MKALDRKLLRDVWRLRSQVLTIALVVASGVGGFIGSISAHTSLAALRDQFYESARFAHVFAPVRRAPRTLIGRLRELPGVIDVDATIVASTTIAIDGVPELMSGQIVSLPRHRGAGMNRVVLDHGRWIDDDDRRGVLLSRTFARARGIEPGRRLVLLMNGRREEVIVRGIAVSPAYVFAASQGGFADDTRFGILWMPEQRLAGAYDLRGAFNLLTVRVTDESSVRPVIATLDRRLAAYGSTGAFARAEQISHKILTQEIDQQKVFGTVLPSVFLAVAAFLLHVLMTRHIATERTQLAALKAVGYGGGAIARHYFLFTALIVLVGVGLGIVVGYFFGQWMTGLYARVFAFPSATFTMEARVVAAAAVITVVAGFAATTSAVRAILRLPAAEAMRPPAPARFRRTLLERLRLGKVLPVAARMVVRETERRPFRAVLISLGIACSVAIVIAGTWWGPAFDALVDTELFQRDRADVTLALNEPAVVGAMAEIRRMPGVMMAEPSRVVGVRLRHGAREYRTTLVGLDADARLHRVQDADGRDIPLQPGVLVLTDRLARRLGVRPGDRLAVESLEGSRRVRDWVVGAESGDLMGMLAYASRPDAARLAGEGDSFNVARVRLDPRQDERFFAAVRDTPRIGAAGDKRRMVENFRANQQHNLLMFAAILSVFAACIALGVVYNAARISLAEQAWELATLRVIGLTRTEVSWTLLGQLFAQMSIALPLGWVAGRALAALILRLISSEEFRIPLVVDLNTYLLASLVMLGAGGVAAFAVRRRIDRLDLVGVLKTRD